MAVTLDFFPRPRRDRATPGGVFEPLAIAPTTHVLPFSLSAGVAQRSTRSFGPLRGPGLIHRVEWRFSTSPAGDVGDQFFAVAWARAKADETNVARAAAAPFQRVYQVLTGNTAQHPADAHGSSHIRRAVPHDPGQLDVDIIVRADEWFAVVTFETLTAIGAVHGTLVVLEGVNPDALANFL